MSKLLINEYYQNLDRTLQYGKSSNEQSIRNHFWHLLNDYARKLNYEVIPEVSVMGTRGKKVYPDGTVKNLWGLDIGLWESKDEKDDIEAEIDAKIVKGYPLTNILFEDSNLAVLFQRGIEVMRVKVRDVDSFDKILTMFIGFKSESVYQFEEAIEKFKADIPIIVETLRTKIMEDRANNAQFIAEQNTFFELCKVEINPSITLDDIREMMIQHILTSDIFNKIFDDPDFHHHNTIASELEKLTATLFTYPERRNLLNSIEHYYQAINSTAAGITDHHEKQKFLKVLYQNFYKVYNPKAADRLGVIYTPNEIVSFMVKSTNYLLHKYFGRTLADHNVEILDPATGTGTFICEIIENAIPKQNLDYKFKNELHANEVAILPYYIANLNIEYTFKQKMQYYAEFPNLCFVDTIDNTGGLVFEGKQHDLFGLSSENSERIKRQNRKKISVIIGNPPYNANQLNENENNKNREYPFIDKRIKDTFIKHSTAQKTKVYDMYARFYRWAMDRIEQNGVLAMITNRSFIDSRTFDGFRKCIQSEFSHCYIIDTLSDVRANPKIAGTTHNVFGIQTGVAIMFLIKKDKQAGNCMIEYVSMDDYWRKEEKLDWLKNNQIENIHFQTIHPDKNNNWINLSEENDWENLIPVADKDVKLGRSKKAIFELFFTGVPTNRDGWVYDLNKNNLINKMNFFSETFNKNLGKNEFDNRLKWSRDLKNELLRGNKSSFNSKYIVQAVYRPFIKQFQYTEKILNDVLTQNHYDVFGSNLNEVNKIICIPGVGIDRPYHCISVKYLPHLQITPNGQCLPAKRYNKANQYVDNITDWGLEQFFTHYDDETITKEDIFHYTYAVLHNPVYREKYKLNLKREFPRLPFYNDFKKWAAWGKSLMELHINYETAKPYNLEVLTFETKTEAKAEVKRQKEMFIVVSEPDELFIRIPKIKPRLKAIKNIGIIEIDDLTFLKGVPSIAWEYKLGNRSAIEWILDQYKEKKPTDPTIADQFNTYRFADYKDKVIELIQRVCTVSVETMKITEEMKLEFKIQ